MQDLDELRDKWAEATADLPYGVQRVFHDVLTLVKEEKKKDLIYGADYYNNGACLVNAAANMLVVGGGYGIPMEAFGRVVSLYDQINREFRSRDINTDQHVSPLAAEILLAWYAPLKDAPAPVETPDTSNTVFAEGMPYVEPTDEEMAQALSDMFSEPAPQETINLTPFDPEYAHKNAE